MDSDHADRARWFARDLGSDGFRFEMTPHFAPLVSPTLVASMHMLALPSDALEREVERELVENPALERVEHTRCPSCGAAPTCHLCWAAKTTGVSRERAGTQVPMVADIPEPPDERARLLRDLRAAIRREDGFVAGFVVDCLNDRGFLDSDPAEIASRIGVTAEDVVRVVDGLRAIGPVGIGARDLRESLLLQLDALDNEGDVHPLARPIVEHHLDALGHGRTKAIARALGTDEAEVLSARAFIRGHLHPYPGLDSEPEPWDTPTDAPPVVPDVVIGMGEDGSGTFAVAVEERRRLALQTNPVYRRLADELRGTGGRWIGSTPARLSPSEAEHVLAHVDRADAFRTRLEQRWETIRRVAEYLVEQQREFLTKGPRFLRPLTRAEVAAALGIHESTVSRAISSKYVRLPTGNVVAFRDFFDASLGVREVLRRLIASESTPMSDADLSRELALLGHPVARRTVAKYRNRIGVVASSLR